LLIQDPQLDGAPFLRGADQCGLRLQIVDFIRRLVFRPIERDLRDLLPLLLIEALRPQLGDAIDRGFQCRFLGIAILGVGVDLLALCDPLLLQELLFDRATLEGIEPPARSTD
jgi:hypothetical protein